MDNQPRERTSRPRVSREYLQSQQFLSPKNCVKRGCDRPNEKYGYCKKHFSGLGKGPSFSTLSLAFVYAISSDEQPDLVKIGVSNDLDYRLMTLQTASPFKLRLLGAVGGSKVLEGLIHKLLEDYNVRGEWFRYEGKAKLIIDAISSNDLKQLDACLDGM